MKRPGPQGGPADPSVSPNARASTGRSMAAEHSGSGQPNTGQSDAAGGGAMNGADAPQAASGSAGGAQSAGSAQSLLPAVTTPRGGGAIRGIGEKFAFDAATGSASLSVPIAASPGRGSAGPAVSLSYGSGNGNGPFGAGFRLSVPQITRKTDKGLPRYWDGDDTDIYVMSGAEDLVPVLNEAGQPESPRRGDYTVRRYRPRIEGAFARIERWRHASGRIHWRVTTPDNQTHLYGLSEARDTEGTRTFADPRIADPAEPRRTFAWLLEETRDDKGNVTRYEYKAEDGAGITPNDPAERSRFDLSTSPPQFTATAQRYLKRILYGNRTPVTPSNDPTETFPDEDYLFELLFDYGEHAEDEPTPEEANDWSRRLDPFSSYRARFDIRTTRLCRRTLMFHRFTPDGAPGLGPPLLVGSTEFQYEQGPAFTYLTGVTQRGYQRNPDSGVLESAVLPTLELDYTRAELNDRVESLSEESLAGLAGATDGNRKQWVDLDGEGIAGVLIDADGGWLYKRNRGGGELDPPRVLASIPSPSSLTDGTQSLQDLAGDGQLDLVSYAGPHRGYFTRTPDGEFSPLRTFQSLPNIDWNDPNLRLIDLDGDGFADLLISEDHAFVWYRSRAKEGFDAAQRVAQPFDEREGPAVVFSDPEQSVQLADMSGDGLIDIVRVRNGEVCYWPNLGYGHFGNKITLVNSPTFAEPEAFDARRVRFGDVDGSGTSDVFYLGVDGIDVYLNEAGNRLSDAQTIRSLPPVDSVSQLSIADLLGTGTSCLVWSSPLGHPHASILCVDLMNSIKPHLLNQVSNNLGATTHLTYTSSTQFYLADQRAGTPWLTRLPFPVQVVERIERHDAISGGRLVSRYSYRHGFFDGEEREFRGFARVETLDAEDFADEGSDPLLYQPPVRTVSWYHTGAWLEKERLEHALRAEYFDGGPPPLLVTDNPPVHELQEGEEVSIQRLSVQDAREATRVLKGSMLRREVYAQDGSDQAAIPYVITEANQAVRRLQASRGESRYGVFLAYDREAVTVTSERNPSDPRVGHEIALNVDHYGAVTRKVSVVYGRASTAIDAQPEQTRPYVTLTEATHAHQDDPSDSVYRLATPVESRVYEVTGISLPNPSTTSEPPVVGSALASVEALRAALDDPAVVDIDFDQAPGFGVVRRLIGHQQQTFYVDSFTVADAGVPEPSPNLELPLGQVGQRALPYRTYQLGLTAGHVAQLVSDSTTLTGTAFDPTLLTTEGGYVERDSNGHYWAVSARAVFDITQFSLPVAAIDPFGGISRVQWDDFALLVASATDPVDNHTQSENDYRVLAPRRVTDPNLNRVEVAFDALGMVTATAVMGKDDGSPAGDTIDDPTTRLQYDLLAYQERGEPAVVHTIAREQHGATTPATRFQHSYTYSDGFGRVVMQKVQAEPGEAPLRDGDGELERDPQTGELIIGSVPERWVGTGRTIFNNKGNPVKQYEPFFSSTSAFESESDLVQWGVSPIIRYDSIDRVVRTDLPDGSFTRVEYDAWEQRTFDQNDTLIDATGELSPWYTERGAPDPNGAEPGDAETRAAWLGAQHANTPTTVYLDSLGRPFLSVAHNRTGTGAGRVDAYYRTRTVLDIEGNPLAVYDARQHDTSTPDNHALSPSAYATVQQTFDVLQRRLRVVSADAGTRVAAQDTANRPLRSFDSRGSTGRTQFDAAQRPTRMFVAQGGSETLVARLVYGEELDTSGPSTDPTIPSSAQALNLRGQVLLTYDGAGVVRTEQADFKGNVLRTTRRLAATYQQTPTWDPLSTVQGPTAVETAAEPLLEPEVFETQSSFDALNRIVTSTAPASNALANAPSVTRYEYNEASLLGAVYVTVRGGAEETVISNIDYNARGQRLRCEHAATSGTPAHTVAYTYDPETFRVETITTTRSTDPVTLQALSYTYDAVGNIVAKLDDATWDPDLANALGGGNRLYQYDALYRLTRATGREHAGQQVDASDPPYGNIPHGNDLSGLRDYVEVTTYDEVGNIVEMRHLTGPSNNQSWSRRYSYASDSNRLLATSIPGDGDGDFSATYEYDTTTTNNAGAHGSMTSMPHLEVLEWDYADRLQHTLRSNGSNQHTYFTYDSTGQRVRKVYVHDGIAEERIYLGSVELYRRRSVDGSGNLGTISVERETLHVMDDTRRVAMAETLTVDSGGTEPIAVGQTRWRYQLDDHLGSSAMELDDAGQVISYEEYHPYGSTAFHLFSGSAEVSAKRYRYTGKERDDETGLYYHGARYYAPWLGRWTAADPAGLVDGLNLYRYSRDNPVRFSDPGGTRSQESDDGANDLVELGTFEEGGVIYRRYSAFAGDFVYEEAIGSAAQSPDEVSSVPSAPPAKSGGTKQTAPEVTPAPAEAAEENPGLLDRAREYVQESEAAQFALGLGVGGLAGAAPGGFAVGIGGEATGASEEFPRAFRLGYGLGEAAWGLAQIIAGVGGEVGGGALTAAGAGASATGAGALVGVPAMAGGVATIAASTAAIAEGSADIAAGASVFMSALKSPGGSGSSGGGPRISGDALKAARGEFNKVKPQFWKDQATRNPGAWSADDLARMKQGKAPIGPDGYPMELHHRTPLAEGGTNTFDNLAPMTRTEHRLGPNYKKHHPNLP